MEDMNALFGQLRAQLNEFDTPPNQEASPREDALLDLLKRAHQTHPTRYEQEWITYLKSHAERLNFKAYTREEFEEIASLTPVGASLTWVVKGHPYTAAERSRAAFAHVLASAAITRVTHLEFYDVNYGQDALFPLCEADLPHLTQLSFRSCYLREKLINRIVNASWCAHIKTLNIIHMSYLKGALLSPLLDKEKLPSLVTLRLCDTLPDLHALSQGKLPDTLSHIDMRDSKVEQSYVQKMAQSPHFAGQRITLDMRGCELDPNTRHVLLNHTLFTIDAVFGDSFKGQSAKKAHIERLAEEGHLAHLVGPCHVRGATMNREAANLLLGHHDLKQLDALHLCFRHTPRTHETLIYDASTFTSLVKNDALHALRSLSLHHFTLDAAGMRMWCEASWLSGLTHLSLAKCELALTLDELKEFVSHPHFPALTHLDLSRTKLTDAQLSVWLEHADCGSLQTLTLQHNRIYMKKMTATELTLPSLKRLDLQHNRLGARGVTFLSHVSMCALKELHLDHNRLEDEGAIRLIDAPWCPQLTLLHMNDNDITHEAAGAWLDSEAFEAIHDGVRCAALHWASRSRALDWELQRVTAQALAQGHTCRLTTPTEVDPRTHAPREDIVTVDVFMTPEGVHLTAHIDASPVGYFSQVEQELHTLTHLRPHINTLVLTGRLLHHEGIHAYFGAHHFPCCTHISLSSMAWFNVIRDTEQLDTLQVFTLNRPHTWVPLMVLCKRECASLTSLIMKWREDEELPAFHELIHAPWLSQLKTIEISPYIDRATHVMLFELSTHGFEGKVRVIAEELERTQSSMHHANLFDVLTGELLEPPPLPSPQIEERGEQIDEDLVDMSTGKMMRAAELCERVDQGRRSLRKGELLEHLHRSGFCYPDTYKLLGHHLLKDVETVRVSTFLSDQDRGDIFEGASIMLKPFFMALFNAEGLQSLHTIDMHSSMMGEHDHVAMSKAMLESLLNSRALARAEQLQVKNLPLHDSIIAWMLAHQDSLHSITCTFERLPHITPDVDTITSLLDSSLNLERDVLLGIKNSS